MHEYLSNVVGDSLQEGVAGNYGQNYPNEEHLVSAGLFGRAIVGESATVKKAKRNKGKTENKHKNGSDCQWSVDSLQSWKAIYVRVKHKASLIASYKRKKQIQGRYKQHSLQQ